MKSAPKISVTHPKIIEALNKFIVPAIQKMPKPESKEKGA
jgi:hypothetical protein